MGMFFFFFFFFGKPCLSHTVYLDIEWGKKYHTVGTISNIKYQNRRKRQKRYPIDNKYMSASHIYMCISLRYMNGAGSNPSADILAYAAAQVKKGMEVAKKLGAENFGTH